MHLGNGAITLECAALGFAAAGAGVTYSGWMARNTSLPSALPRAAALGSLVFAAQMLNVPVLESSSAHFVGGVLLVELLGPALGVLTMFAVLVLQAVLLGDGGIASLGVNVTNMALLPVAAVMLTRRVAKNRWFALLMASSLSIALAVVLIGVEVALGRSPDALGPWTSFMASLTMNHLPALALEASLTVVLVGLWRHGELVADRSAWRLPATAVTIALLLAAFSPVASSSLPDGYESAAEESQMNWLVEAQ